MLSKTPSHGIFSAKITNSQNLFRITEVSTKTAKYKFFLIFVPIKRLNNKKSVKSISNT